MAHPPSYVRAQGSFPFQTLSSPHCRTSTTRAITVYNLDHMAHSSSHPPNGPIPGLSLLLSFLHYDLPPPKALTSTHAAFIKRVTSHLTGNVPLNHVRKQYYGCYNLIIIFWLYLRASAQKSLKFRVWEDEDHFGSRFKLEKPTSPGTGNG